MIKALVGGLGFEAAIFVFVAADFHVIELFGGGGQGVVAGIPGDLEVRVLVEMLGELRNLLWGAVAAHEADAGDLPPVFVQQVV